MVGRHASIFSRGFLVVSLTSLNVLQIAEKHWVGAFIGGFAISFVWWGNSRTAAHAEAVLGREAYAAGAACGTVCGIWLVQVLYG
jgi:hypothetical protein